MINLGETGVSGTLCFLQHKNLLCVCMCVSVKFAWCLPSGQTDRPCFVNKSLLSPCLHKMQACLHVTE